MKRSIVIIAGVMALLVAQMYVMKPAEAQEVTECEITQITPDPANLGDDVTASATITASGDQSYIKFDWYDPDGGNPRQTTTIPVSSGTTVVSDTFNNVDKPGVWNVVVTCLAFDFTPFGFDTGGFLASFLVLPESPIGAVAIVGAAATAATVYVHRRKTL